LVETRNQLGDGITPTGPGGFGDGGVARTIGHGEQGFGASDVSGGFRMRAAEAGEPVRFLGGQQARESFCRRVMGVLLLR
jgi:hypothetical protein